MVRALAVLLGFVGFLFACTAVLAVVNPAIGIFRHGRIHPIPYATAIVLSLLLAALALLGSKKLFATAARR